MAERDRPAPDNPAARAVSALLVLAFVLPVLAACTSDGGPCVVGPVPVSSPAGASRQDPGSVRAELGNGGACEVFVEWNGARYADTRVNKGFYDVWAITDASLTPLGPATAASANLVPMGADTVYAIDGVDPAEAIAMYSWDSRVVVLKSNRHDALPASLCGYFKSPPPAETRLCPTPESHSPPIPTST